MYFNFELNAGVTYLAFAASLETTKRIEADLDDCEKKKKNVKCQMFVYSGHALSYTKLVHRYATQTEGNKYFK